MTITTAPGAVRAADRPTPSPPAGARRTSLGRKVRDNLTGHTFLIGAVLCFAVFSWYPMVRGVVMSFQRTRRGETTWVGWDNYLRILDDPSFWTAWQNTFYFTGLALVLGYAVPFFVAILLNEFRHARGYLRILVYLPVMLPPPRRCSCSSSTRTTPATRGCSTRSSRHWAYRRRSGCSRRR
ncbi:hypothetical protein GCM10029963_44200 [Micromonospora andamanensis]